MAFIGKYRQLTGAVFAGFVAFAAPAFAEQPRHVRGALTDVQAQQITVQTAGGKSEVVKLNDKSAVFVVAPTEFSAIAQNKFIGITSVEKGGKRVALEVHVFNDSLRGLAEGHYPWDLEADANMMTNANVGKVETVGSDRVLKLDFKGGEQTISVPANAIVVSFEKGAAADMKIGAKVFVIATPAEGDAGSTAIAVVVGANGIKPPM